MHKNIIEIRNIDKTFQGKDLEKKKKFTQALRNVSLNIKDGEILGLVGESGSGKTTLGKVVVGLLKPDGGKVIFNGEKISDLSVRKFRPYRKSIQMIFQNPYASLNPSMPIKKIIEEPLLMRGRKNGQIDKEIKTLLKQVNLNKSKLKQLPKHLSGGERRRVGLARILAIEPQVIILDEPVAALDQSIKEQIIGLLTELQRNSKLTYLWISHDLLTIEHVAHRIAIMYHGVVVETLSREDLKNLQHPYSIELFNASKFMANQSISGEKNSFFKIFSDEDNFHLGCPYRNRCVIYKENDFPKKCKNELPQLKDIEPSHQIACHFISE